MPMERNRILIVDDDPALLEALSGMLSLWLFDVTVDACTSTEPALARIAWVDYDVIICEGRLPGMDGATLISEIKKVRPMTPVIVLTGHGEPALARQAFEAGAYDFLFKPTDRHVLLLSVIRAIEAHRFRSRFASEAHRWLSESSRYRVHPHV
jgi:two-component system C4-dicarboxylate transport response regulator DctD